MRVFVTLAAFAAALLCAGAASAQEGPWRITEAQGVVRVQAPGQSLTEAQANVSLPVGSTVTTGGQSRATIENGVQRIVMTANSRMTVAPASESGLTRILQDMGSLLFQVDRRENRHFQVETPLLAAVVKGTTFTVSAGSGEDMVHVSNGLVEVRANAGGAANDVGPGQTARVARAAPAAIAMERGGGHSADTPPAAPSLDYAAVSDGLVGGQESAGARVAMAHGAGSMSSGARNGAEGNGVVQALRQMAGWVIHGGSAGNAGGNGNANGNAGGNGNANGNAGGNGNANGNAGGNGNPELDPRDRGQPP